DFGLAAITRAAGDDGRGQPVAPFSPGRAGTPAYMSPEQLRGDFADSRSDQFTFCATAFEVLYGSAPHAGLSLPERLEVIEAGRVAPVDRRHPAIHLHPILVRGLAADPERRYPTMAALLDDLERAERRRRRRGAIPVTVLALAALLGLVAWLTRRPASQVTVQIVDGLDLTLYSEISSLVQEGRFRECIAATERHPPTAGVLAMRIECARAIGDTPVLEQGCAELAQRYPDYERPAACNEALSIARDLRERGQARQCVELVQAQPAPSLLLVVEMYRCAGDLRDRDVYVSACRFAAKHFPDHYRLQDCPKPLP
ncbi:MAG: protein kinase, partial [Myxococcales bacterium]|nr:protein kinase [Myxococcales bacterium]